MELRRMTSSADALYPAAMALYRDSFPFHEQRVAAAQAAVMGVEEYHFDVIRDGDDWVGLMLYWAADTFLYVEHFCIRPELRGRRYGEWALGLLAEQGKQIILEIDPPVDEISVRRRGFYERCGFCANPYSHVHPSYHAGARGHELVVMSSAAPLTQSEYRHFFDYLCNTVMKH